MNVTLVNISDMESDVPGKTWKEKNSEIKHNFQIGSLVEIIETGVRLFIVKLTRDCDQTPLYSLCYDKDETVQISNSFRNITWVNGYGEDDLKLINS